MNGNPQKDAPGRAQRRRSGKVAKEGPQMSGNVDGVRDAAA